MQSRKFYNLKHIPAIAIEKLLLTDKTITGFH